MALLSSIVFCSAAHFDAFQASLAGTVTLLLMLVSPAVAGRQFIPFFFLMAVPVCYTVNIILASDYRWIGGAETMLKP